jgi:hypothetical protein
MSEQTRYRRHPQTAGRIIDGLAFIVTPDSRRMHTLNATATFLWELAKSGFTAEEAARALVEQYEVDESQALLDSKECVDSMIARQILVAA